jgi:hypothetical protein
VVDVACIGNSESELQRALAELHTRNGAGGRADVDALLSGAEGGKSVLAILHPVEAFITTRMDDAFREQHRRRGHGFRLAGGAVPSAVPWKGVS